MSVRLSLAILCIGSAAGLGFLKGQNLRRRIRILEQLVRFLDHMERELEFGREPLPRIFAKLSEKCSGNLRQFWQNVSREMTEEDRNVCEIFSENMRRFLEDGALFQEDLERLCVFGAELGYPDRQMQIHTVEVYRREAGSLLEELKKQYPQSCRLFRTLGTAAGVLLAVLLW